MKFIYQLKRGHLIIAALLILNITAFFSVSAISASVEEDATEQNTLGESETYIKSGVKVLNWSYSLLRYFRHQDAE